MAGGLNCRLFEAGSSRFHAARISVYGRTVRIDPQDAAVSATIAKVSEIEFSDPVAGLPLRIACPDGRIAEVDETETFFELLAQADVRAAERLRGARLGLKTWVAIVFLAVAMPAALWFGYPVAADAIALSLPRSVDRALGQGVFDQLDGRLFDPTALSASEQRTYRRVFDDLRDAAGADPDAMRLMFRKSDRMGANALALPDGTVVLLDGLVLAAKHEDEVAGVLAHEIGHVLERHAIRKTARSVGIALIVTFALGDTVSILEELAAVGAGVAELSFSREFELEADATARRLMEATGRDPTAMIALLRRLHSGCGEACDDTSILSTHPGLRDRLEAVGGGE